ncbi:uncharacterized protein LOC107271432 isoform X2 [Cephus cinctus]|uniref:Uncharacterized protein LOC107271432 isoform X2 n=1 Tax=Cephus cinctus TaxID=211228 RepID=A0AAJ7C6F9_CEPCN|nr:uncharacterized protein LOC107271432 isoform X2 [Cephus cinctus]
MNHLFKLLDQSPRERCSSPPSNEIESPRLDTLGAKAKKFFSRMNMFTKVREFRDSTPDTRTDTCSKTTKSPSRKLRNEIKVSKSWSSDVFQDSIFGSTSYHSATCKSYNCNERSWQIETENHNPPKSAEEFYPNEDENSREMSTGNDEPRVKKMPLKNTEQESESDASFKSLKISFIGEFKDENEVRSKIPYEDVDLSFMPLENVTQDGIDNTKDKVKEGNDCWLGEDNLEILDMDLTLDIPKSQCMMNHVEPCENESKNNDSDNANNIKLSMSSYKSCDSENMSEDLATLTSINELNPLDVGILMNDSSEKIENADIKEECLMNNDMHEVSVEKPRTPLLDNADNLEVIESSNRKLYDNNMENIQEMEISLKRSLTLENQSENSSSFYDFLNVSNIESPGDKHLLETDEMIHTEENNETPGHKRFQKTSSPKSISNDSGYQNHSSASSTERSSLSAVTSDSRDVSYEPKIVTDLANISDLYVTAMEDSVKNENDCLMMKTSDLLKQ